MDLTHDDVKKILEIIDSAAHLDELELVYGGFHLRIHRSARPMPPSHQLSDSVTRPSAKTPLEPSPRPLVETEHTLGPREIPVRAPMLGTFYRSPAPGEPPFVELGQQVKGNDTVCLIEVMKLFSSIKAGVDGVVKQILPANGELVEFKQLLLVIEMDV